MRSTNERLRSVEDRLSDDWPQRKDRALARALQVIRDDPYYLVLHYRYYERRDDPYIAKMFVCAVSTVRRNRKRLLARIADELENPSNSRGNKINHFRRYFYD